MQLKAPIENWMSTSPVTVSKSELVGNAIKIMSREKISSILITEEGYVRGIFSERDVVKHLAQTGANIIDAPIENYMTKNPICVNYHEDYNAVYLKMYVNNIRHVPVLKEGRLIGIVSIRDLLRFYDNSTEEALAETRGKLNELEKMLKLSQNEQINELIDRVKMLEEMSLTDHLTGLYNYRYFEKRLTEEFGRAQRYNQELTIIFCDIDLFKSVNDTYGHKTGDAVLRALSQIFSNAINQGESLSKLRKSDIVARYGGEEFVIILPQTPKSGGLVTAERVRKIVEANTFNSEHGENIGRLTLSFGVAEYPADAATAEELIKRADSAMYAAKKSGRNSVVAWNPSLNEHTHD